MSFWIPFSNDTAGDTVALSIDLTPESSPVKVKRAPTACELTITMNGTTVYEAPVLYDTPPSTVVTDSVPLGGGLTLIIQETCSGTMIPLTVSHLMLLVTVPNVVPSSSPGTDTGTETGTGTGTGILTVSSGTSSPITIGISTLPPTNSNTQTIGISTPGSKSTTSGGTLSSSTPINPGSSSPTGSGTGTLQTGTSTSAPPSSTSTASGSGFPSPIGPFAFFGCVGSIDNYPTFSLVASSSEMTIETCTSACTGSLYSGVYDTYVFTDIHTPQSLSSRVKLTVPQGLLLRRRNRLRRHRHCGARPMQHPLPRRPKRILRRVAGCLAPAPAGRHPEHHLSHRLRLHRVPFRFRGRQHDHGGAHGQRDGNPPRHLHPHRPRLRHRRRIRLDSRLLPALRPTYGSCVCQRVLRRHLHFRGRHLERDAPRHGLCAGVVQLSRRLGLPACDLPGRVMWGTDSVQAGAVY
ncbi:hypothetical protein CONLIGDRAFT_636722 [Coniochaeta ligniaria NRRL 30616]|uniref:WSC domain-containing protein n=1 Tax=Coniochaeta ligniaria NRRL 30616 TaxID=1408157 RepID=A0A1J7IAS4_9PEZI|nr:hypothetical protein CONLIGDRAFT_636722 [Coniochaeta ligniaria NRRL 30616]